MSTCGAIGVVLGQRAATSSAVFSTEIVEPAAGLTTATLPAGKVTATLHDLGVEGGLGALEGGVELVAVDRGLELLVGPTRRLFQTSEGLMLNPERSSTVPA